MKRNYYIKLILALLLVARSAIAGQVLYLYDSLNRLTDVDYGNGSIISYTYDAAGNRLTYSGAVANDTIAPSISITNPTSAWSFTNTSATINLSGTASDNTGVTLVTWENDSGGIGVASGTDTWSINGIPLKGGENDIFVTAYDAAGNTGTATLVVTYVVPPVVQITGLTIASNATANVTVSGAVGGVLAIQTSTNLVQWYTIGIVTNATGSFQFPFPFSSTESKRFFRLSNAGGTPADNTWAISAGGSSDDTATAVAMGPDGVCYVTGTFQGTASFGPTNLTSQGQRDIFLAAYGPAGQLLWVTQAGGANDESPKAMAVDASGNLFVVGWFATSTVFGTNTLTAGASGSLFVAKFDSTGQLLWVHSAGAGGYNGAVANACTVDKNGAVYVTGFFSGQATFWDGYSRTPSGWYGIFLMKISADGHIVWLDTFGDNTSNNFGTGVAVDTNLNCFLTGIYAQKTFLAKYDPTNAQQWLNQGDVSSYWPSIASDNAGGVYFMADFSGSATFGGIPVSGVGGVDAVLGRYGGSGNALWMRVIGGTNDDDIRSVTSDTEGNCFATGSFQGTASIGGQTLISAGGTDVFITKYAADGTPLWAVQAGGVGADAGNGIATDSLGGVWTAGDFSSTAVFGGSPLSSAGGTDAFLMKWNANP
jgi:YD repeat-containing protein